MDSFYIIGVDFGSDSVRALLVDAGNGREVAESEFRYPRWGEGRYTDVASSCFRQHPLDFLEGLEHVLKDVVSKCPDPGRVRAVGVDTTSSTPCLVDRSGMPLSLKPEYADDRDAMFVLWKDHTAVAESGLITDAVRRSGAGYMKYCGGYYSAECYWSKIMHIMKGSARLRESAWTAVELCDWIPAVLTGCRDISAMKVGRCAAGSKMMWAEDWGGFPPAEFFAAMDAATGRVASNLPESVAGNTVPAGRLCGEWAGKTGLGEDVVVCTGCIDAHAGAVGAGIAYGTMVLNLGTSACHMAVMPAEEMKGRQIEGIFGQVDGSIIPGMIGFESGMSAFGDIFAWLKRLLSWPLDTFGKMSGSGEVHKFCADAENRMLGLLGECAGKIQAATDAPVATDHFNGRRSPDPRPGLKAAVAGLSLADSAPEFYYALSEAAAFATRAVIEHLVDGGVAVEDMVAVGGIALKSPFIMQMLANVTGKPIKVSGSSLPCALGAAVNAAVASGIYASVPEAQSRMCPPCRTEYTPGGNSAPVLDARYRRYISLGSFMDHFYV